MKGLSVYWNKNYFYILSSILLYHRFDEIFVIGSTESCKNGATSNDNFMKMTAVTSQCPRSQSRAGKWIELPIWSLATHVFIMYVFRWGQSGFITAQKADYTELPCFLFEQLKVVDKNNMLKNLHCHSLGVFFSWHNTILGLLEILFISNNVITPLNTMHHTNWANNCK